MKDECAWQQWQVSMCLFDRMCMTAMVCVYFVTMNVHDSNGRCLFCYNECEWQQWQVSIFGYNECAWQQWQVSILLQWMCMTALINVYCLSQWMCMAAMAGVYLICLNKMCITAMLNVYFFVTIECAWQQWQVSILGYNECAHDSFDKRLFMLQ